MKGLKKLLTGAQVAITLFVLIAFYNLFYKLTGWDYYEKVYLFIIFHVILILFLINFIGTLIHERKRHLTIMLGTIQIVTSIMLGLILVQVYNTHTGILLTHLGLTLLIIPLMFIVSAIGYTINKKRLVVREILWTIQITVSAIIIIALIILGMIGEESTYYFLLNIIPVLYILSALEYLVKK
jgi:hypothetical protein